jgi:hypothetical protein
VSQLQTSSTYTEPSTGHPLSDKQTTHLANHVVLRSAIRLFFKRAAADVKVGTHHLWRASGLDWRENEEWDGAWLAPCSMPNRRLGP